MDELDHTKDLEYIKIRIPRKYQVLADITLERLWLKFAREIMAKAFDEETAKSVVWIDPNPELTEQFKNWLPSNL